MKKLGTLFLQGLIAILPIALTVSDVPHRFLPFYTSWSGAAGSAVSFLRTPANQSSWRVS